ncbi:CDP-glycerol glycerophosphotransferase family protein [Heyndrickxia vini]|uniref:CDP-glycerol glycerophosphotransferase family protein n=1 Tax=Heyndrickxia vini TaxID=1476025 RepID=A0ABX7E503_9BACI|nr:CDP-glycerol glycerophosphotransferase family protein [Heyndrickxia vini]QQZ10354.1 CDP-glycerol glycerophosphotransferase family protein [Heyndrickxia vini]
MSSSKSKESQQPFLHRLEVHQNSNDLIIKGDFTNNFQACELWIRSQDKEQSIKIAEMAPSSTFHFEMNMEKIYKQLQIKHQKEVFNFYLTTDTNKFIRLGCFAKTHITIKNAFTFDGENSYLFLTKKGNLSISFNQEPKFRQKNQIIKVSGKQNTVHIKGKIITYSSLLLNCSVLLKGRETRKEIIVPITFTHLEQESAAKYGFNRYSYEAKLPMHEIDNGKLIVEDIYDLFLVMHVHDHQEEIVKRITNPISLDKNIIKEVNATDNNLVAVISPYFTFKKYNLSLEVTIFSRENFAYMNRLLRWAWLLRPFFKRKDIWIVGERTYKAQDTGYHFFKYMRQQHRNKHVYYIMDTKSPEYKNVESLGNVLDFKSKQHIFNTIMSTRVISSHHPDYLFPIRTKKFKQAVRATKVFLQHGVMGTKNMVANYGKDAIGFDTDLFLVSSDFEKNMIINEFGYTPDQVFVTGLSRFDDLLKNDIATKRQLLIIPTWRDWIGSKSNFLETEYYERYHELVTNKKLHDLAIEYQFDIVFCLHPNMQKYTSNFKNAPIKVISQGEVNVQTLLKESALMVTDYSSVAFDFSFLHKPIIYYQFDRDKFFGDKPSHLDIDNDLPGDIVFEEDSLLALLEDYAKKNFQAKEENIIKSTKFLKYRDQESNNRIYKVIKENSK